MLSYIFMEDNMNWRKKYVVTSEAKSSFIAVYERNETNIGRTRGK